MLVGRHAVSAPSVAERRVDDRDVRQRAGGAVRVVVGHRPCPGHATRAPDRREGQVGVVVARGQQPRAGHVRRVVPQGTVEQRLPLVARRLGGRRVVLPAARLGRPLVVAVRPGRGHQRAVEAVVDRELRARRVDEAEIALVVVAERELVAVPGEEAVGLTGRVEPGAAELGAAAAPGVVGVRMAAPLPLGLAERRRVAGVDRDAAVVRVEICALPAPRRRSAASRNSGRRSGSPSSGSRNGRSGRSTGWAASRRAPPRWRPPKGAGSTGGRQRLRQARR